MNVSDTFAERRVQFEPLAQERGRHTCPCCGYPSLQERYGYEICTICFWEDDGQDDADADEVWGGPNSDYSLSEARANFDRYGTMYAKRDRRHFERETGEKRERTKRKLVKAFESVRDADSGAEREAAWKQAGKIG